MRDYLAILRPKPSDALQFGIRGMRWGVRRTDAQLAKDIAARKASGEPVTDSAKSAGIKAMTGEESSAERYSRLASQAKGGGASNMSEADLKFFNARTDAINKVNKMYETKPNWLVEAAGDVARQTVKNSMQSVTKSLTDKYIQEALNKKNPPETVEQAIAKKVAELKRNSDIEAGVLSAFDSPGDYAGRHVKGLAGNSAYRGKRAKR